MNRHFTSLQPLALFLLRGIDPRKRLELKMLRKEEKLESSLLPHKPIRSEMFRLSVSPPPSLAFSFSRSQVPHRDLKVASNDVRIRSTEIPSTKVGSTPRFSVGVLFNLLLLEPTYHSLQGNPKDGIYTVSLRI